MPRRLKGTVVNPQPSWNIRNMAGASSSTGPLALGDLGAVALINDSPQGEWLVVWDFSIVAVPNPIPVGLIIADVNIGTGRNSGSLLIANNSNPIISQGISQPGTNWTLNSPNNEIGRVINSVSLITAGTYAYYFWNHDWPLGAIAPGDSMIAYSDANPYHDFGANFIYEVIPGAV